MKLDSLGGMVSSLLFSSLLFSSLLFLMSGPWGLRPCHAADRPDLPGPGLDLPVDLDGDAHEFLTGLSFAGGGLTFTQGGIALVSEEENLIAIDGWRYAFLRGDADANLQLQINDVTRISNWLFLGGPEPACWDSADVNDNSVIDVTDSIYLANALFSGGPAPAAPYPDPGIDPTADLFGCASYAPSQEIDW